jgi:hypothetical protein
MTEQEREEIEREEELYTEAKECHLVKGRQDTRLAEIYREVIDNKLWRHRCRDLPEWLEAVGDHKQSQAYAMASVEREFADTIPANVMEKIPYVNLRDLREVPESKRTAEMMQAATKLTNNQLRETLNKAVPGLALEQKNYIGFQLEKSALELIEKTIKFIKEREDIGTNAGALEYIVSQFCISEGIDFTPTKKDEPIPVATERVQ